MYNVAREKYCSPQKIILKTDQCHLIIYTIYIIHCSILVSSDIFHIIMYNLDPDIYLDSSQQWYYYWSCRVGLNVDKISLVLQCLCVWSMLVSPPGVEWSLRNLALAGGYYQETSATNSHYLVFSWQTVLPARWVSVMNIFTMKTSKISFRNLRSRCLLNRSGGSSHHLRVRVASVNSPRQKSGLRKGFAFWVLFFYYMKTFRKST